MALPTNLAVEATDGIHQGAYAQTMSYLYKRGPHFPTSALIILVALIMPRARNTPRPRRLRLTHGLLTWPRSGNSTREEARDLLFRVFGEPQIKHWRVGQETHQDGSLHLHAWVHLKRRWESVRIDILDLNGKHPNITEFGRKKEDYINGWEYLDKDHEGAPIGSSESSPYSVPTTDDNWRHLVESSTTAHEFLSGAVESMPDRAIRSWSNVARFAEWRFEQNEDPFLYVSELPDPQRESLPPDVTNWLDTEYLVRVTDLNPNPNPNPKLSLLIDQKP